jgi:hypothetical protein
MRAQDRLFDDDAKALGDIRTDLASSTADGDRRPGRRGDLPGEPDEAQSVAAVRLHVHVQDDIAVKLGQVGTEWRTRRQDEDPVRVGRELELVARAEHPSLATPIAGVDPPSPGGRRRDTGTRCRAAMFVAPHTTRSARRATRVRELVGAGCFST